MGEKRNAEKRSKNNYSAKAGLNSLLNDFFGFFVPDEHIISFLRTDWNRSFGLKSKHMAINSGVLMSLSPGLDQLIKQTKAIQPDARSLRDIYKSTGKDINSMSSKCGDKQARQLFVEVYSALDDAVARTSDQVIARQLDIDALVDTLSELSLNLRSALEGTGNQAKKWVPDEQFGNGNNPDVSRTYAKSVSSNLPGQAETLASLPKAVDSNAQLSHDLSKEKTDHKSTKEELRKMSESYDSLHQEYASLLNTAHDKIDELKQQIANFESDNLILRIKVEDQNREVHNYFEKVVQLEETIRPFNPLTVDEFLRSATSELPPAFRAFVEELLRLTDSFGQHSPDGRNNTEINDKIDQIAEVVYQLPPGKDLIATDRFTPADRIYQVTLLQNRLQHQLEERGLGLVYPAVGEAFDSNKHLSDDSKIHWFRKGYSHNTIAAVNAIGFSFNGQVLKKAQVEKYMRDQTEVAEPESEEKVETLFTPTDEEPDELQGQSPAGEEELTGEITELIEEAIIVPPSTAQASPTANEEQDVEEREIKEDQKQAVEAIASSLPAHVDVAPKHQENDSQETVPYSQEADFNRSDNLDDTEKGISATDGISTQAEPMTSHTDLEAIEKPSPKSSRKRQVPEDAY